MSDTSKQKTLNLQGAPLTVGVLLALVVGVVWIGSMVSEGREIVNEAATKAATQAVTSHAQRPVDVSHPDLPKQYTSQVEFRLGVQQIRGDIKAMRREQQATGDAIKKLSDQVQSSSRANRRRRPR